MKVSQLFEDTRIPVIAAPLFIISYPELVIAQCKAGVIGSFPALNARPAEELENWIIKISSELENYKKENPEEVVAPFAVNQICHSSNDRLEHDVDVCVKHKVPMVITSLRAPKFVVDSIHSYGGVVMHDVINVRHAKKAVDEGDIDQIELFMKYPNRAFDRSQLLDRVWGRGVFLDDRTVDVHVLRLRKTLKPVGCDHLIETVRGVGYRLAAL